MPRVFEHTVELRDIPELSPQPVIAPASSIAVTDGSTAALFPSERYRIAWRWSPRGRKLIYRFGSASGSADKPRPVDHSTTVNPRRLAFIVDVESGERTAVPGDGAGFAVSDDGERVAFTRGYEDDGGEFRIPGGLVDAACDVYQVSPWQRVASFEESRLPVDVAFSGDGRSVTTVGEDAANIASWSLDDAPPSEAPGPSQLSHAAGPGGSTAELAQSADGATFIIRTGSREHSLQCAGPLPLGANRLEAVGFSPDGVHLFRGEADRCYIYNAASLEMTAAVAGRPIGFDCTGELWCGEPRKNDRIALIAPASGRTLGEFRRALIDGSGRRLRTQPGDGTAVLIDPITAEREPPVRLAELRKRGPRALIALGGSVTAVGASFGPEFSSLQLVCPTRGAIALRSGALERYDTSGAIVSRVSVTSGRTRRAPSLHLRAWAANAPVFVAVSLAAGRPTSLLWFRSDTMAPLAATPVPSYARVALSPDGSAVAISAPGHFVFRIASPKLS